MAKRKPKSKTERSREALRERIDRVVEAEREVGEVGDPGDHDWMPDAIDAQFEAELAEMSGDDERADRLAASVFRRVDYAGSFLGGPSSILSDDE